MAKKTPENISKDDVKDLIEEVCAARGLKYKIDWHAGSAFESTLDGTGVVAGHPFIAEVKRWDENEQLTGRQVLQKREFQAAGAHVFDLVDRTALAYLRLWLETLEPREPYEP